MVVSVPPVPALLDDLLSPIADAIDLGHAALNASFLRQVSAAISSGGCTGPAMAGLSPEKSREAMADLASFYRFVNNEKASLDSMRRARAKVTLGRIDACKEPLVIAHDLTFLNYFPHDSKEDRIPASDGRALGYEYHNCLALGGDSGATLGVLHDTVVSKKGPDDRNMLDYHEDETFAAIKSKKEQAKLRANHRHQFAVHATGLGRILEGRPAIHVGDAEFDDLFIMIACEEAESSFVLRAKGERLIHIRNASWIPRDIHYRGHNTGHPLREGYVRTSVERLLPFLKTTRYKKVYVNSKGRISERPEAGLREARLSIGACTVTLFRDAKRNGQFFETDHPVEVNLVYIVEKNPPRGTKPVRWILYTNLPVAKSKQRRTVADYYGLRWKAECFYRLMKSGYRLEESRLNSPAKIARLAIIISLAAMAISHLKDAAGLPVGGQLDDKSYERLKEAGRAIDDETIDLPLRVVAYMARLGGWLGRRTDPLGSDVLMRGAKAFAAVIHATVNHEQFVKELLGKQDVLKWLIRV